MKVQKNKKCKNCGDNFYPSKTTQIVCGWKCAIIHSNAVTKKNVLKESRAETKRLKEKYNTVTPSQHKMMLQKVFNKFIRIRDLKRGCISCGVSLENKKYDAGHFWASTYQGLRFNEQNVFGQCVHCNQHKRSNAHEYRLRITERITPAQLQWLDDHRNDELKLSVPEIKEMIVLYKQKIKNLKNAD